MKRHILLFLIVAISVSATYAQICKKRSYDFGIMGGAAYYIGDINLRKQFYSPNPVYGIIGRISYNNRYSARLSLVRATIQGNDSDFTNQYQLERAASFKNNISELAYQMEFSFLPYDMKEETSIFSPYIAAGLSIVDIQHVKSLVLGIPMSFGVKLKISHRWSCGAEWTFRKLFTDKLDLITRKYFAPRTTYQGKQYNYQNNKDWYSFGYAFLTYTFYENKGKCSSYWTK